MEPVETIILTAAPLSQNGRRLTYIVDGDPAVIDDAINLAREEGRSYPVPDRDNEGEFTYLNPDQVVCCYRKPVR